MIDVRLRRWVSAQRIGFCAYRLNQPFFGRQPYRDLLEDKLGGQTAGSPMLAALPATTVETLLDIHPRRLGSVLEQRRPEWSAVLRRLTESAGGGWSVMGGAELIAYHLIHGSVRSTDFLRAAKTFLSGWWSFREADDELQQAIQKAAEVFRDPFRVTLADRAGARLAAIRDVAHAVRRVRFISGQNTTTSHWVQVENVLYHHVFQWPLFTSDGNSYGFSLPIIVEVSFDGRGRANDAHVSGLKTLDISDWQTCISSCITAAKELWLSQHGSRSRFAHEVRDASVTVDFDLAESVVAPASAAGERVRLEGRSMEAYFTQVILSQLIGAPETPVNAATGVLGRPHKAGHRTYDYDIEWPVGVNQKLQYVFKTRLFSRVVVPSGGSFDLGEAPQTATVAQAGRLSVFADVFQTTNWRRDTFIRVPDLQRDRAELPLLAGRRFEPPRASVTRCLRLLRSSDSAVVDLGNNVSPQDLITTSAYLRRQQRLPISWMFVRCVQDEQDERFWHLIWKAIGAKRADFDDLQWSRSTEAAARVVATALNEFSPAVSNPRHRTPDVLVVIGFERFDATPDRSIDVSTTKVQAVIRLLARRLLPVPNERAARWIGNTRIVLVHDGAGAEPKPRLADPLLSQVLVRLAVFRFAFSHQMAAFMLRALGIRGLSVREVLTTLADNGELSRVRGGYYLEASVGVGESRGTALERAQMHKDAAIACAPQLLKSDRASVDLYRAFEPELVHEAQYHLERAARYASGLPDGREVFQFAKNGLVGLARWFDSGGRCSLATLWRFNHAREAEQIADELLEMEGAASSPAVLRFAAAAKMRRASELGPNVTFVQALRKEASALWERALEASSREGSAAADYLASLTQYAAFLLKYAGREDLDRLAALNTAARSLVEAGAREGLAPEWCHRTADAERDHGRAAFFYRLASELKPKSLWILVKWIGAASLGGMDVADVYAAIASRLPEFDVNSLRMWLAGERVGRLQDDRQFEHIRARARQGLVVIRTLPGLD
jgi:hypothetical protein